jgi:ribosomal-protein-alanine N-acetyltransferase
MGTMPLAAVDAIETARLRLVPVGAEHLPALLPINGDAEVTRFLPYATWAGLDDARAWLARMDTMTRAGTAHQLVLLRRDDGTAIGTLLLFRHDEPSRRIELGYVLGRAYGRRGYMREAVAAACAHAFARLDIRRIEAEVNPANTASCRLLEQAGFTHEGTLRQRWFGKGRVYDTRLYGRLSDDPAP